MPRPLPLSDFRAVRIVLEDSAFALAPEEPSSPLDLVDEEIWQDIMTLPDDVAIRTSNDHGRVLRLLQQVWESWIEAATGCEGPIRDGALDAADEFQAATFNSLHGYCRQAFGCLRTALEMVVICTYCKVLGEEAAYSDWRAGKVKIEFDKACGKLENAPALDRLTQHLQLRVNDSLFGGKDKQKGTPGGWARRLHSTLSDYEHGGPGFTNFDLWDSNGPVYSPQNFVATASTFLETCALCFLLAKTAEPLFTLPEKAWRLWTWEEVRMPAIAGEAFRFLFE